MCLSPPCPLCLSRGSYYSRLQRALWPVQGPVSIHRRARERSQRERSVLLWTLIVGTSAVIYSTTIRQWLFDLELGWMEFFASALEHHCVGASGLLQYSTRRALASLQPFSNMHVLFHAGLV